MPRRLKQIQRPDGIDIEVVERNFRGPVVLGLRRSVDNDIGRNRLDQRSNARPVANIKLVMRKGRIGRLQPCLIPTRVALRTEKFGTHVIIDAMDRVSHRRKKGNDFASNQAAGPCNE